MINALLWIGLQPLPLTLEAGIIHPGDFQLNTHLTSLMVKCSALLCLIFLSSCNLGSTPSENATIQTYVPTPKLKLDPTRTPFTPDLATPTPGILHLWISPTLPGAISERLMSLNSIADRPLEIAPQEDMADVRVEPESDVPLTAWIYAAVAPFPSLRDTITWDDLSLLWNGGHSGPETLYIPREDLLTLELLFDGTPAENVTILGADELLEQAWLNSDGIALLPFESIEPHWKVLEVDGSSPIRKDFDTEGYPLAATFGLSGVPDDIAALMETLEWPRSNRDPEKLTVLVMTGVTALTRATAWTMEMKGIEYPAEKISHWLLEADITHISNEVSFYDLCPTPTPAREGLIFCSDPDYIQLLQAIDVDVIELTGNHLEDYGEEPFLDTLEMYDENGWGYFGGGKDLEDSLQPLLIEHHGNKLAFLGCNSVGPYSVLAKESSAGAAPCDYERLFSQLTQLRSEGYLPIFTFQWNEYYQAKPTTQQMEKFRAVIDAGAIIVSGSQAHQPQTMEFYGGGFIHYGLGNLFFDQMWSIAVRQEFLDRYIFYDGKHISTELLTAFLEDYAQPRPMTEDERSYFLGEIFTASGWIVQ
jgi:hypothetical protein